MAVALPVMHTNSGLLSFLFSELISEKEIRNKQLVGPTSHVFNLLLISQQAVVKRNENGPFNWCGKEEAEG